MTMVSFFPGRIHLQPLNNCFHAAIFAERETIVKF
jgi:hypothetical protein